MYRFRIYLLKLFVKNLLIVLLLTSVLQWLSSAYGNLNILQGQDYTLTDFVVVTSYGIILGINQLMPMVISVTIIITIIMLMRYNELIGYVSIGGSLVRIAAPLVMIGLLISILMLIIDYKIIPDARTARENKLAEMQGFQVSNQVNIFHNQWFMDKNQVVTNIGFISVTNKVVYNVKEYFFDKDHKIDLVVSIEKIIEENNQWIAYNVIKQDISTNPPQIKNIEKEVIDGDFWNKLVSIRTADIRGYSQSELYTLINLFKAKGLKTNELEILLYFKFALALSVITLLILLYPISIDFSRNYSIVKNASLSFSLALVFMIVQHSLRALGNNGLFSPLVAVFTPLILFLIVGILLIYYRSKVK